MLGPAKARRRDEPIAVSLENLVPRNHFYRHLDATLDLSFVREWVQELYAERGRPGIDPVVFFKLQLIMFFEGIRSERQLLETASLNLAHRWYLGYALDEKLPDHSSLTRIRQRLGVDVLQRFFEKIVDLCQEAGLVWGREIYVDAKSHVADLFADDPMTNGHEGEGADPPPAENGGDAAEGVLHLPPAAVQPVAIAAPIRHPGSCWKSGGWTHNVHPPVATCARATSE